MNRRAFILGSLGAISLGVIYKEFPFPLGGADFELAVAYGDWVGSTIDKIDPPLPSYLVFVNPSTYKMQHFKVPFRVHMLVQNPRDPDALILISKWGTQIASFSRKQGRVTKVKEAQPQHRFFGHAVWDKEHDGFWVSQMDDANTAGKLVLRGADLEVRREIPSHGIFPHEVQHAGPGRILIANSGDFYGGHTSLPLAQRISNLTWLSTETGEIQRRVEFPDQLGHAGASHFQQIPGTGEVFSGTMIADQNSPSVVFRVSADNKVTQLQSLAKDVFRGEIVSFGYCADAGRVFWTHSKAEGVFSFDIRHGEYAELSVPKSAKGLIAFKHDVLIANGDRPKLLDWKSGRVSVKGTGPRLEPVMLQWGSHFSKILS